MTQEEIIEMAKQAGYQHPDAVGTCEDFAYFELEAFAKLVAEKEREWLIDLLNTKYKTTPPSIVKAIRARGQA